MKYVRKNVKQDFEFGNNCIPNAKLKTDKQITKQTSTCPKLAIETLGNDVKYVQS